MQCDTTVERKGFNVRACVSVLIAKNDDENNIYIIKTQLLCVCVCVCVCLFVRIVLRDGGIKTALIIEIETNFQK